MRLNLGCGNDIKNGYVNVDIRKTHPEVMIADLSVLPWPFEDGSADEILMLDFLEHFPWALTDRMLLECNRVLKPEGTLVVQVPDATHLARALTSQGEYLCNRCGYEMDDYRSVSGKCGQCGQTVSEISEAAMKRLYGGQDYPGNFHQTCFTTVSLARKAKDCGLIFIDTEEDEHQYKNWNFKMRFKRGDVW